MAPGIYARAFLEGRLTEEQLLGFRQEVGGGGLSSYPHPWLMPDFWQFPTVSMGLGPLMAIYQARFLKYLHARGLADTANRHVWAFLGDGEMDEPESLGAISLASREKLDNLIFVVNCNLQRLDGPVRGNGKIIQELEGIFRGAGWNVIKVVWGSGWDPLLAADKSGLLLKRMEECVDGEYQDFKSKNGAYVREHFFGKYPELLDLVKDMTDDQIWALSRGGHDPSKVYAAYKAAVDNVGTPTVILAKTVKGYGMGEAGEGQNITHQQKKMGENVLRAFRDRFGIVDLPDEQIPEVPFLRAQGGQPGAGLPARAAGGAGRRRCRSRRTQSTETLPVPGAVGVRRPAQAHRRAGRSPRRWRSSGSSPRCCATSRSASGWCRSSRTSRARSAWRACSASSGSGRQVGQLYRPEDANQLMYYKEDKSGQMLQEGINEAGAMSSWIAAATCYSVSDTPMIPFYVYYSMFGFQRIGDLAWAAGDSRARGFLIGGTAGRTTLNGEGLQHEDGHSHLISATIPNCVSYDPTYAHEVAVIIQDGLRRMFTEQEDVFYYLTIMNENYEHPGHAGGPARRGDRGDQARHVPAASTAPRPTGRRARACSCWAAARSCARSRRPPTCSRAEHGVAADVWSCPSFTELGRDTIAADRWNLLHPGESRAHRLGHEQLAERPAGPVVAATDYMRAFAEQIRPSVPADRRYVVLGTDGFGRSDYRKALRRHFEVDRHHVVVATLSALAADGAVPASAVTDAIARYGIDPDKLDPAAPERPVDAQRQRPSTLQVGEEGPCPRQPRSGSPTSATSATCRSSRCTSPPVTRSTPRTRC